MPSLDWSPGLFVWRELTTGDVDAARRFYAGLLGWTWSAMEMKREGPAPGGTYWIAASGARQVGGAMATPAGRSIPSAWSSYVLADDVDAAAARCREAGGRVLQPPEDIPGVGRFAVLTDPWGAVFLPFRGSQEEPAPPEPPGPGSFCWETLVTPDPAAAAAFYGRVVGFGTGRTPDGQGTVLTAGGQAVADLQPARPGATSSWSTYVAVERVEATRDLAVKLGGRVLVPRIDVPKVGVVAVIADPGGAALGLFQPG